jgi:hypothetical protein
VHSCDADLLLGTGAIEQMHNQQTTKAIIDCIGKDGRRQMYKWHGYYHHKTSTLSVQSQLAEKKRLVGAGSELAVAKAGSTAAGGTASALTASS